MIFFSNFIYFSWLKTSDKQFAAVYFTRISAIGVCVARAIFHSNWHPLGLVFTWANFRDLGGRYVTNTNRFHTSQHFHRNRKKHFFFLSSKHLGKIPKSLLARLVSTWERTLRKWDTIPNTPTAHVPFRAWHVACFTKLVARIRRLRTPDDTILVLSCKIDPGIDFHTLL